MAGCVLAGCSPTKYVGVGPGEYSLEGGRSEADEAAARVIQNMTIDRGSGVAVFALLDGSEIETSFVPRDRAEWPSGCPTNIYTHRMEVLDIEQEELAIGPITFTDPILVRDCPPDPVHVVLREDGEIGNSGGVSGSACGRTEPCICFKPARDLPWRANDGAVSTDQDNAVTFDIVVSADEAYGKIDAGTFTVVSGPENGTATSSLERTGTIREDAGFDTSGAFIIRIVDLVTYTSDTGFHGADTFSYRICDMEGYCDAATVTVTVNAVPGEETAQ
jgi:hypothetical protein